MVSPRGSRRDGRAGGASNGQTDRAGWRPHEAPAAGTSERVGQLGHGRKQIGLQAEVGDAEDRGLGVLVDRHDHLGILHAGQVLDGTRDATSDVQLRRHNLAGLADLQVVGRVARRSSTV